MRALILALSLGAGLAGAPVSAAVTVLSGGRIHTGDVDRPTAEAMAWDGEGRLLALGDSKALLARYPDAQRVDAAGRIVVPGLIDGHGHLMNLGRFLLRVDLVGTRSKDEVLARARAFAATLPPGAWLLGRGWDQNDWPESSFPTASELDAAFPDRPVWLERVDGHAGWANSAAMRATGRDFDGDWQPEGGRILRQDGRATGVFVDAATELVERAVPVADAALRAQGLELALAAAVRNGLTGVHDMGASLEDLALMRRFADEGRLPLRIRAYADGDGAALRALCAMGPYEHAGGRLAMRGVKFYVDGALGSRGAALLDDYSDEPGHRGLEVTEAAAYLAAVKRSRECGLQVTSHAIGDRGNRIALDTYARVLGNAVDSDHRWRIEHAQVIAVPDLARFRQLQVVASMQPIHATSDMPWAEARVGKARLAGAYAWQSLHALGVALALGSDFPTEPVDPRLGLYAAVTRQDLTGKPRGGWRPDERLTPAQALAGFTAGAAFAAFDDGELGRLHPGFRADFVMLDADPLTVRARDLPSLRVLSTWVDGRPVYQAQP